MSSHSAAQVRIQLLCCCWVTSHCIATKAPSVLVFYCNMFWWKNTDTHIPMPVEDEFSFLLLLYHATGLLDLSVQLQDNNSAGRRQSSTFPLGCKVRPHTHNLASYVAEMSPKVNTQSSPHLVLHHVFCLLALDTMVLVSCYFLLSI